MFKSKYAEKLAKMKQARRIKVGKMKADGLTYKEIGLAMGISAQRAWRIHKGMA